MKWRAVQLLLATMVLGAALIAREAGALADIGLATNGGLGFGQIIVTGTSGTVTVTTTGSRSASGGVALGNGFGVSPATFTVTGEADTAYGITLPSSVTLTGGQGSMVMDTFTSSPSGSGNLGPGRSQAVSVGATLHVGASQPPGSYSGTYAVTVAYN